MDINWNLSTTIRNPERITDFARVLYKSSEGKLWDHDAQDKYQISLIQNKLYSPKKEDWTSEQEKLFKQNGIMTFKEAQEIWDYNKINLKKKSYSRKGFEGKRGRDSASPLSKLGIFYKDADKKIRFTEVGKRLVTDKINLNDLFYYATFFFQLPQHKKDRSYPKKKNYDIIPFLGILQLIHQVNILWEKKGNKPVGLSSEEFNIFATTLINKNELHNKAKAVISFRIGLKSRKNYTKKTEFINETKRKLTGITKTAWKKANTQKREFSEYGDNIRRCLRLSGWISTRGNGRYIDLNPNRQIELMFILPMSLPSTEFEGDEEYSKYISNNILNPNLPWETKASLLKKYQLITHSVVELKKALKKSLGHLPYTTNQLTKMEIPKIKEEIRKREKEFQELNQEKDKAEITLNPEKLCDIIDALENIKDAAFRSIELEYQTSCAFFALDDAINIKPNYKVADDGKPSMTAGAGLPDIETFYKKFDAIIEVTMNNGANQYYAEGQSVPRHARNFKEQSKNSENICVFIAPSIHDDTLGTYLYENSMNKAKIVPITIVQFTEILHAIKKLKLENPKRVFPHETLLELYRKILEKGNESKGDKNKWRDEIPKAINGWICNILSSS